MNDILNRYVYGNESYKSVADLNISLESDIDDEYSGYCEMRRNKFEELMLSITVCGCGDIEDECTAFIEYISNNIYYKKLVGNNHTFLHSEIFQIKRLSTTMNSGDLQLMCCYILPINKVNKKNPKGLLLVFDISSIDNFNKLCNHDKSFNAILKDDDFKDFTNDVSKLFSVVISRVSKYREVMCMINRDIINTSINYQNPYTNRFKFIILEFTLETDIMEYNEYKDDDEDEEDFI